MTVQTKYTIDDLPGLNCGLCGLRSCEEMVTRLETHPELIKRCIYLSNDRFETQQIASENRAHPVDAIVASPAGPQADKTPFATAEPVTETCNTCAVSPQASNAAYMAGRSQPWHDTLGREFDFYLEHFPEEPGPREIILPHNPAITKEMEVHPGDILIGRPLGMSCGCPITHCGVAMSVDYRTGIIVWCVTGPLNPRQKGFKDLGYYIAEGYEGLVKEARCEIKIGMRYFFQPRMCMLQWRHSGLVNFMNRTPDGAQIRVEGLWIG